MFSEEQNIFFPPIENNLIYLYIMWTLWNT